MGEWRGGTFLRCGIGGGAQAPAEVGEVAPTTVDVETDSSTFSFAGKFCVSVRSAEMEACQLQHRVFVLVH